MERSEIVNGLIDYFKGDQWRRLASALIQDPDPQNTHAHMWVDTSVDPKALERLIIGYFEQRGYPNNRRIDWLTPRPRIGSLHGVEPRALAHFDFNWSYNPDVVLVPNPKGGNGCNLSIWNKAYIDEFYKDFPFRPVGFGEEEALRNYFRSDHWHQGLEWAIQPTTTHTHINVHSSVHPDAIQRFALESLNEKGWTVDYVCPNVFLVAGRFTGKLVFMGRSPEAVYDIGWKFDPEVVIEPTKEDWDRPGIPGYDIITEKDNEEILSHPYIRLSEADIQQVLAATAP